MNVTQPPSFVEAAPLNPAGVVMSYNKARHEFRDIAQELMPLAAAVIGA